MTDPSSGTAGSGGADASTPERIAVVCGGVDDQALLERARELALAWEASLSLVSVVEPDDLAGLARFFSLSPGETETRLMAEQRRRLEALATQHGDQVPVTVDVRLGKPFLEAIRHVLEHDCQLLLKTAERLGGVRHGVLASTDQHLLRKCPCPVWLRLPNAPREVRAVLAGVDVDDLGRTPADRSAALNRRIVETAALLAAFHQAPLHLLHVWDAPAEDVVRRWAGSEAGVGAYVEQIRRQRRDALEPLRRHAAELRAPDGAQAPAVIPHLIRGLPRAVVPAQVAELGVDLLVMGTIARTGVPGLIIGNTAEDVLNSVDCAVVTVKPPGYVTPVKP